MGILYGWKKEYLLQSMTFGQIILYLNEGLRFKYPKPQKLGGSTGANGSLIGASAETINKRLNELHEQYGPVPGNN